MTDETLNIELIDAVINMSDKDFYAYFDSTNIFIEPLNKFIYVVRSLTVDEQDLYLNIIFSKLLDQYRNNLDKDTILIRALKVSKFFSDIHNPPLTVPELNDFIIFYHRVKKLASIDENIILWHYLIDYLCEGMLHPFIYTKDYIDDYIDLGKSIVSSTDHNLDWWLPIYTKPTIMTMPAAVAELTTLLYVPDSYKKIYNALGLSLAESYIHYKNELALPLIESKVTLIELN